MPQQLPSLLLLPPPPVPIDPAALSAAYRPTIAATVSTLKGLSTSTELLIVLSSPSLHGHLTEPRSHIYDEAQKFLGGIYSLFCMVCANLAVDVESETPGSVDARVVLLDYNGQEFSADYEEGVNRLVSGPIIDLPTLAFTRRRWKLIFSVDGAEGQKLLDSYSNLASRISPPIQGQVQSVSCGVSMVQKEAGSIRTPPPTSKIHYIVAIGGTFDHIHAGHKLLLSAMTLLLQPGSFSSTTPRRLIIGITGDQLLKNKKYAEYLKTWKQRQEDVVDFLLSILLFSRSSVEESIETLLFDEPIPNGRAVHTKLKAAAITIECVEIQDPFGPTITDENITALVVSGETRSGGQAINDKRTEKGWTPLEVYEIDVLDAQDSGDAPSKTENFASKISSTAIRRRKADHGWTSSL